MESGQSAVESGILSRDVVVSVGLAELNCGWSANGERTVRSIDLKFDQRSSWFWWDCSSVFRTVRY